MIMVKRQHGLGCIREISQYKLRKNQISKTKATTESYRLDIHIMYGISLCDLF